MITILPANEKQREILGLTDPSVCAMVVAGEDVIREYIVFSIGTTDMELLEMRTDDFVLQEGLVRAALNFGFRREKQTAVCKVPEMKEILEFLQFRKQENGYFVELSEFFSRGCKCCKMIYFDIL